MNITVYDIKTNMNRRMNDRFTGGVLTGYVGYGEWMGRAVRRGLECRPGGLNNELTWVCYILSSALRHIAHTDTRANTPETRLPPLQSSLAAAASNCALSRHRRHTWNPALPRLVLLGQFHSSSSRRYGPLQAWRYALLSSCSIHNRGTVSTVDVGILFFLCDCSRSFTSVFRRRRAWEKS